MIRRPAGASARVDVQMTPMIDVVFQLLTFFLMTFRIAVPEGDISLRLPHGDAQHDPGRFADEVIRVRLRARADGDLAELQIAGSSPLAGPTIFAELHARVLRLVGAARDADRPEPVVELDADDLLHYEIILAAVTAVARQVDDHGEIVPLVSRVKFSPR